MIQCHTEPGRQPTSKHPSLGQDLGEQPEDRLAANAVDLVRGLHRLVQAPHDVQHLACEWIRINVPRTMIPGVNRTATTTPLSTRRLMSALTGSGQRNQAPKSITFVCIRLR